MKNNMIYLSDYKAVNTNSVSAINYRASKKNVYTKIVAIADAFATFSIGICTIFCMYLAYTML